jgi:hypothetical protein
MFIIINQVKEKYISFLTTQNPYYVNTAAFATVVALAGITVAAGIAAGTTATTVATVAYSILAVTGVAVSGAAISAYLHQGSVTVEKYFKTLSSHSGYAIAAVYQLVAQAVVQGLIEGLVRGVSKNIERKLTGPDVTYRRA